VLTVSFLVLNVRKQNLCPLLVTRNIKDLYCVRRYWFTFNVGQFNVVA